MHFRYFYPVFPFLMGTVSTALLSGCRQPESSTSGLSGLAVTPSAEANTGEAEPSEPEPEPSHQSQKPSQSHRVPKT